MSKTINKKYFLLQNLFYQSIPNKSFVYKKNLSLEKTEKNIKILDNQSESNKVRNESSFRGKSHPLQKIGKKQPILNDCFLPVSKNLIQTYNYVHRNKLNRQVPLGSLNFGNKLILQKNASKVSPLFRKEIFRNFEESTKSQSFSKVQFRNQIRVNLSFHKFLKSPSNSLNRSAIHGFNFPYKKSFFCYWLLPFLGFVSCFPILKNDQFSFSIDNKIKKKETQIFTNISYAKKPSSSYFSIPMDNHRIMNWESQFNVSQTSPFREIQNLSYLYSLDLEKTLQANQSFELSSFFEVPKVQRSKNLDPVKDLKENLIILNSNKVETCINFALSKTWKKKSHLPFWQSLNLFNPLFDSISISDPYFSQILLNSSFKNYFIESKLKTLQPISFLRQGQIQSWIGLLNRYEKKESANKVLFSSEFAKKLEKDSFANLLVRSNSSINLKELGSKNPLVLQNLRDSLFSKSSQPISFFLDLNEISESKEKNFDFSKLKQNQSSKSPVFGFKKVSKLLKNFFGTCNDWSMVNSVKVKNQNLESVDFDKNFKIDDNLYKVSPLILMKSFSKVSDSSKPLKNNLPRQKKFNVEMTSFLEDEILDLLDVFPKNQSPKLKKLKTLLKSVKKPESNLNDSEIKNVLNKGDSPLLRKFQKESLYSLIFSDGFFKKEDSNLVSLNFGEQDEKNLNKSETFLAKDGSKFKEFLDRDFIKNYLADSKETSMYQPILKIDPIWIANSKKKTKVSFASKKDMNLSNLSLKASFNFASQKQRLLKGSDKFSTLNNLGVYNHSKEFLEMKIQNPKRIYFNQYKKQKFFFGTQNKTDFKNSAFHRSLNSSKYLNLLLNKMKGFWLTHDLQQWPAVNLMKTKMKIQKMKTKSSKVKLNQEVRNSRFKNNSLKTRFDKKEFNLKEVTTQPMKASVCINAKPWAKEKKSFPTFSKLEKICNSYFSVKFSVFNKSLSQKNFSRRNFVYLKNRMTSQNLIKKKIQIPSSSLGFGSFKSGSSTVILNQNSKNSLLKNHGTKPSISEVLTKHSQKKSRANFSPNLFVKNRLMLFKKKSPLLNPMGMRLKYDLKKRQNFKFLMSPEVNHGNNGFKIKKYWGQKLKKKYKQRKNRKKKLRGEIIKKRQRYYPRPTWIRSQMYKQFITSRYPLKFIQINNSNNSNSNDKSYLGFQTFRNIENLNKFSPAETSQNFSNLNLKQSVRSKIYRNYQENPFFLNNSIKTSRLKNSVINSQNLENHFNLYEISRKTLGKLKKDCWKSYWLRSNLNPYLKRINLSLRSFKEQIKNPKQNFQLIYSGNLSKREMNGVEFEENNKNIELFVNLNIKNGLRVKNQFKNLLTGNQWQRLTNLREYQRILSQRMQQTISNIRENVRVDGDAKARASRIGNRKLLKDSSVSFRIGKTLTFPIPTSTSSIPFYGDMSKIATLWTLNQSNISQSTLLNHRKSFWQNQKQRSQARSNKTKKILYKMNKLAKSSLTEFNKISFSKFQSIPKSVELEFISNLKQKPFFNKFVITSFETKESLNPFLNFYFPEVYTKSLVLNDKFFDSQLFGKNDYSLESNSFTIDDLFIGETHKNYNQFLKKSFSIGEAKLRKKEQKLAYLGFLNGKKSFLSEFKRQDPFKVGKFTPSISDAWWNPAPFKEVLEFHNPLEKNRKIFDSFGAYTLSEAKFKVDPNLNAWIQEKNDLKEIGRWVSPFLFHFCSVLFFLNIPEIRGFMKWNVIWFSTLFKIYLTMAINISSLVLSSNKDKPGKNFNGKNEAIVLPKISRLRKSYFIHIQKYRLLWFKPNTYFQRSQNLSKANLNFLKSEDVKKINEKPLFFKVGEMGVSPFKLGKQNLDGSMELINKAKFIIEPKVSPVSIGLDFWIRPTQKWLYFSVLNLWTKNFLPKSKNLSPSENSYIIDPTKSALEQKLLFLKKLPPSVAKRISLKKIRQSRAKSKRLAMAESLGEKRWGVLKNQSRLNKKTRDELKLIFFKWQISTFAKIYFEMSLWFLKGFDTLQAMLGSIYFFFEKPGDLLVDMFAYAFLVEWSSDFLGTIPESQHMDSIRTINTSARAVRPFLMSYPLLHLNGSQFSSTFSNFGSWTLWTSSAFLLNRQILEMYEMILQKWFQPDNDLTLRQKKGRIFWDLWSQVFIDVADDANINIVELTSLKEEQNRLFEKLEALEDRSENKIKGFHSKFFRTKEKAKASFEDPFKLRPLPIQPLNLQKFETTPQLRMRITDPHQHWKYWSIHQSFAYQGKDTDLFIQKSPSKSFSQIPSIKYSKSAPTTIGKMVCQIYSGIFYDKMAKNILVVGGNNGQSPLIIQAIAGETEFKMIQDNAQRYTMVQNGVAIGIKLLKDVFEALSSHTPCLFLLEDIHHIGGRRPLLFSDQAAMPPEESGYDKQAPLDEKNQVTYNFSKHIINHYKKPYKGDFSLLIPTNHFSLNLFTEGSSPQIRTNLGSVNNFETFQTENKTSSRSDQMKISPLERWLDFHSKDSKNKNLSSSFQIESNQLLAPPATSPFSVLLLKENQKFKPQQVVKEMPWGGLPSEKLALLSKFNYSIRVKIALLTDKALSNLSIQLDMITDLLVIIDGVKGDRGFIVFATTHIPYNLDPALRRPGRFDETISLPLIPNLLNRWDIFKIQSNHEKPSPYSFFSKGRTVDFTKMYGLFQSNYGVISLLRKTKNLKNQVLLSNLREGTKNQNLSSQKYFTLTYNLTNPLRNDRKNAVGLIDPSWSRNLSKIHFEKSSQQIKGKKIESFRSKNRSQAKFANPINKANYNSKIGDLIGTDLITRPYFYGSQAVISFFLPNLAKRNLESNNSKVTEKTNKQFFMPSPDVFLLNSPIYLSMFVSPQTFSACLTQLIAGKLGELFISSSLTYQSMSKMQNEFFVSENQKNMNFAKMNRKEIGNPGFIMLGESQNLFGIEKIWKAATSLLFSILTKRYLYNQNLIIPKLLYFSNYSSLQQSPSPPTSTILLPLKRYENYRRTFSTQQIQKKQNFEGKTLQEIWEFHQQQRFVKRLYKLPLREYFRSEIIKNKFSGFANSLIVLSSVEKNMNFTTNINHYYRNRILNRHQNYLKNQWWTGQLYEHNLETTFLSSIDWRSTSFDSTQDVSIDFPDFDQFYNVQNRRWMLTSNSWQNWLSSEKTNYNSIMNQYIFDCMIRAFNSLDQSREILDFYAFSSLNECILKDLKEITILSLWKRFSESKK